MPSTDIQGVVTIPATTATAHHHPSYFYINSILMTPNLGSSMSLPSFLDRWPGKDFLRLLA